MLWFAARIWNASMKAEGAVRVAVVVLNGLHTQQSGTMHKF